MIAYISFAAANFAWISALAVRFRARRTLASRLFAVGMLLLAAEAALDFLSFHDYSVADFVFWQRLKWIAVSLLPVVWVTFSLTYSRGNYPDYLKKWRLALTALGLLPPVLLLAGDLLPVSGVPAADVGVWTSELGQVPILLLVILLGACVVVLMNLEQTFRASVGTQRWRLKFVVIGLGALFCARVYSASQTLLYRSIMENMELLNGAALIVACLMIGASMLRTGEFSIDLYPSQTALHRSVIVIAVGVYLVVVGLLAKIAAWIGLADQFQFNALLVFFALVLLALLLMSDKLRQRLDAWLSRHFQRPSYDYRKAWQGFNAAVSGQLTEPEAGSHVARWISQTLNTLSVSIWLLDDDRTTLRLAGTTLDREQLPSFAEGSGHNPAGGGPGPAIAALSEAIDLDANPPGSLSALASLQPRIFPNGGHRLAIPLAHGTRSIGVLLAGDRVNGVPFTTEDRELLQTIAEQTAGLIMGIRLARRLVEAREMEAFQNMSTFFVHDLKNTASSLSLMLQNLPRHFDNPSFREDALRSIRKSVGHINQMIESLSALRRQQVVDPVPGNLADLQKVIEQLGHERGIRIECDFRPAGPVLMDWEQIGRVATNLIINAHEASTNGRPVSVQTAVTGDSARLTVRDDGCGMTPEFLRLQLFRPFQTTKKTGTGIGLYHSKLIIDAHGGRMEVHSKPGVGTSVSVLLPIVKA